MLCDAVDVVPGNTATPLPDSVYELTQFIVTGLTSGGCSQEKKTFVFPLRYQRHMLVQPKDADR